MKLCQDTPHNLTPIYKVLVHKGTGTSLYAFVGGNAQHIDILKKIEKGGVASLTDADKQALTKAYGPKWDSNFGLRMGATRVYFEKYTLYDDEHIYVTKAKIARALGLQSSADIYLWCNRAMTDKRAYWKAVLEDWGADMNLISGGMLKALVESICSEKIDIKTDGNFAFDEALVELMQHRYQFVGVPLGFKYTQNGKNVFFPVHPGVGDVTHDPNEKLLLHDEGSKHLEYFMPFSRTLHVMLRSDLSNDLYFPKGLKDVGNVKSLRNDDAIESAYRQHYKDYTNQCFVGYAQFRNMVGVPFEVATINVDRAFNEVELAETDVIFAKKLTRTSGSMVKMIKSLMMTEKRSDILKWAKMDVFKRGILCDSLIMKLNTPGIDVGAPITLVILGNGTCDLKVRAGLMHSSVGRETLIEVLKFANRIIAKIGEATGVELMPFDENVFQVHPSATHTRILNMTIGSTIRTKARIADTKQLENVFASHKDLGNAFAFVGSSGGIIEFIYRRVNDFASDYQIQSYLARNGNLKKTELAERLISLFGMDEKEAINVIRDQKTKYKQEAAKLGFGKGKGNKKGTLAALMGGLASIGPTHLLKVRVKPTGVGYRVVCDGVTQDIYYRRIVRLLKVLFADATSKKAKASKKGATNANGKLTGVFDNANNTDANPGDDDDIADIDDDIANEFIDDLGIDIDQFFNNIANAADDTPDGPSNTEDSLDTAETSALPDKKYYEKYVIGELNKADKVLFTVVGEGLESYARVCQSYSKRQPVVISKDDRQRIDKRFPGSYKNILDYRENNYICPDVWCPKSRYSMSREQFEKEGRKCPDPNINEKPIVFYDKPYWTGKDGVAGNRYVGFLGAEKHQLNLCLPCCFKMPTDVSKGCASKDEEKGNIRYIKGDSIPVAVKRYGLLPKPLSDFMKNKVMGNRENGTGLMKKDINAFLRFGVEITKNPFLSVMSQVLNNDTLKTEADVVEAICANLDIVTFMSLYNGNLFKKFLSIVNPASIYDVNVFTQFRGWLTANRAYVRSFGLEDVSKILKSSFHFNKNMPFARRVHREFMFWGAYTSFINDYMKNDNIVKTHEFLLDLFNMNFSWLNSKGYNIIVLEIDAKGDVYVPCSQASNIRSMKDFVLVIKGYKYYEPIHHVRIDGSELVTTTRFNKDNFEAVSKLHKYIVGGKICQKSLAAKEKMNVLLNVIKGIGESVNCYALDYDFQIVGLVLSESGILLPLPRQYSLVAYNGNAKFGFIEDVLQSIDVIKEETVRKIVGRLNDALGDEMFKLASTARKYEGFSLIESSSKSGIIPFIPLGPIPKELKHVQGMISGLYDDVNMLIKHEDIDPRIELVQHNRFVDSLTRSLWNEVVRYIRGKRTIYENVMFLRNQQNPIPKAHKLAILYSYIDKYIRSVTKQDSARVSDVESFHNRLCSSIGKIKDCIGQCKWTVVFKKNKADEVAGGKCKLDTPLLIFNNIVAKVLLDILNVNIPIKAVAVSSREDKDEVVVFTDSDIKNGRLERLFKETDGIDEWGFKRRDETILDTDFIDLKTASRSGDRATTSLIVGTVFDTLPTDMRKDLKSSFEVNIIESYDSMILYDMFSKVYNAIHAVNNAAIDLMTPAKLKDLVIQRIIAECRRDFDDTIKSLSYNPLFDTFASKHKNLDVDAIVEYISKNTYFPSKFELGILADICQINIYIWSRKSQRNLSNYWCLGKFTNAPYTLIMRQSTSKTSDKHDKYEFIAKSKSKVLLEDDDFEEGMRTKIKKQCTRIVI